MAAQYGTAVFKGSKTYHKDFYLGDGTGVLARWDAGSGSGAATPQKVSFPETVLLTDICLAAATGTTRLLPTINGQNTGACLRQAFYVSTVENRPAPGVVIPAGAEFTFAELT